MAEFTEQRVVNKLGEYWRSLKGERDYPNKDEVEPEAIKEMWPYCFIIKVDDEEEDEIKKYSFEYLGDEAAKVYGIDIDGKIPSPSTIEYLFPCLDAVLKGKEPITDEFHIQDTFGDDLMGRQGFFPLSKDGKKINYILGATGCKKEKYNCFYSLNT